MGSPRGFLELIKRHGDKAYNFAFRLSGNEADARDLVSEALARAFEEFGRFDASRPFDPWLLRILRNIYLDGVRRYARRRQVSLDAPAPDEDSSWEELLAGADPAPEAELARREEADMISRALATLPLHYRTAVVLGDVEGLSYGQMAQVMGVPVGTVRSRLHQGRVLLRTAFVSLEKAGGSHEAP